MKTPANPDPHYLKSAIKTLGRFSACVMKDASGLAESIAGHVEA